MLVFIIQHILFFFNEIEQQPSNSEFKKMIDEMLQGEALRSLSGILHTDMTVEEIREERLAKYIK